MSLKIQNVSQQSIPLIVEGEQFNLKPRETAVLPINKETPQIRALKEKGLIKIRL